MKRFWLLIPIFTLVMAGVALAGKTITLKGSDTMVILNQRWAENYMNNHPGEVVQVTGGGSGVGISALINGTTGICASSRPMKDSEQKKLRERYNTLGVGIPVAKDGVTLFLNASNPISELSLEQLKNIYTRKVKNWRELGGPDASILLYGRESSSGTYVFFKDTVLLGADFAPETQTMPGTAAIVNAVAKDPNGIGYGGVAYASGVKHLKIKKTAGAAAYDPTQENVKSGVYPLSRDLFFYLQKSPTGDIKKFIDWVLSPAGQEIVTKVGYFPVK
ncbi:MAG: phosphate ABC transporter substrate-binding protein [Proteobacteria bacterium]|nr:phosphate ABC transporter substrate-binding protein [Pseudomonadota bacterium]